MQIYVPTFTTGNTDSSKPTYSARQFEDYIQRLLDYAKSSKELSEAVKMWGMSWEEYESQLRRLLVPPTIYTTASTGDENAIIDINRESH